MSWARQALVSLLYKGVSVLGVYEQADLVSGVNSTLSGRGVRKVWIISQVVKKKMLCRPKLDPLHLILHLVLHVR